MDFRHDRFVVVRRDLSCNIKRRSRLLRHGRRRTIFPPHGRCPSPLAHARLQSDHPGNLVSDSHCQRPLRPTVHLRDFYGCTSFVPYRRRIIHPAPQTSRDTASVSLSRVSDRTCCLRARLGSLGPEYFGRAPLGSTRWHCDCVARCSRISVLEANQPEGSRTNRPVASRHWTFRDFVGQNQCFSFTPRKLAGPSTSRGTKPANMDRPVLRLNTFFSA